MKDALWELAQRLEGSGSRVKATPVVVGFDAFVDQVYTVVAERIDSGKFERIPEIRDFGAWITGSSGKSGSREAVLMEQAAGGCAVNQGDALASLGFPLSAFVGGASDSAFDEFRAKCLSVEDTGIQPGRSVVYEFNDGKLMFCSFSHFAAMTPDFLHDQLSRIRYLERCAQASAIVITSWSVYPHMNACWRHLQKEVLAGLTQRPRLFFDIADPASRSPGELREMLETIAGFEAIGPVTLSLNANEAQQLAKAVGLDPDREVMGAALRQMAGITELGIHGIEWAMSSTAEGDVTVASAYTPTPAKSVGAGDRFNAGWLAGSLIGLPQNLRLLMACACSGFFVRKARSATLPELAAFVRAWAGGSIE